MPRLSPTRLAAGLVTVVALMVVGACASGTGQDEQGLERAGTSVLSHSTVTSTPRPVAAPVGGQLHTVVPPVSTSAGDDHGTTDAATDGASDVVLLFGDSVSVALADDLAAVIPGTLVVDGVDCRRLDLGFTGPCGGVPGGVQIPRGLDGLRRTVRELATDGVVPDAAVIVIANNSALDRELLDDAMSILADVGKVWWVTTSVEGRAWRDPNNALLADTARSFANAGLVDWFLHSAGHDWFSDYVHPNEAGQAALAAYIAEHLACDCTP